MIKINISKENNIIKEITITGHAMYDDYGKDIVCSAVSTCIITTINAIVELDNSYIDVIENKEFIIKINKTDKVCDTLIKNMLTILNELSEQYPKNIKIL